MFILKTFIMFELVVFFHELGHFLVAKRFGVFVSEFSVGFGPVIFKRFFKKTKFCLRLFLIGGFVNFKDFEFKKISVLKKSLIILAGPFCNILIGIFSIAFVLVLQGKFNSLEVEKTKSYCFLIKPKDEIKAVNNKKVFCVDDFLYELRKIPLKESVNLTVKRGLKEVELKNVGCILKTNEGEKKSLGIVLKIKRLNILNLFVQTFNNFAFILKNVVSAFLNIFKFKNFFSEISGPIGLLKTVQKAEKGGICSLIYLFSFFTINIGIFNLLPFLALDGGQFLFLVLEKVFKVNWLGSNFYFILNFLEILFLVLLFVAVTIKDFFSLLFIKINF